LGVNYNHIEGINQGRSRNINTPLLGTFDPTRPGSGVFPFGANAGNLLLYESTGRFRQDQLIVNTRASIGRLSLFGFYTFAKARSNTDGFNTFPNNTYDLSTEWGRAAYDVRHRLFLGSSARLPWGISASPFITASSGGAYNIVTGRDLFGDNQLQVHRPGIATGPGPGVIFFNGQYLDTNPKPGQALLARNAGQGPRNIGMNLRLSRTWGFGGEPKGAPQDGFGQMMRMGGGGGRGPGGGGPGGGGPMMMGGGPPPGIFGGSASKYNLTLSIQAQNLLNIVNYSNPVGTMTSPNFGQFISTASGFGPGGGGGGNAANRRIQLSLRFAF
jgi:hypothetical protein